MLMAEVIPFPLARRVDLVRRHADRVLELTPDAGERHLLRQVDVQRQALLRKGCAPDVVEAVCRDLEGAMRAEIWKIVLTGHGGVA